MSIDLTINSQLNPTPAQIQDQQGNASGIFITDDVTGVTSIRGTGKFDLGIGDGVGGNGEWIQNSTDGQGGNFGIAFFTGFAEQMRLATTSIGGPALVGIGTSTPSARLHVNGPVRFQGLGVAPAGSIDLVADANGNVFLQGSSARFKENISEFRDDFNKILSLKPVSFQCKHSGEGGVGYIAEDLQEKELQNLVSYDAEGKPFSVHYKLMPVYLLEVLKEQQMMIKELQTEVTELKASIR